MIPILGDLIQAATEIIGKFIPDADKRMEAEIELAKIADGADARFTELLAGQIDVNKIEAANPNVFVSGWRPFLGWVGGVIMGWSFIVAPTVHTIWPHQPLPAIDSGTVVQLILALLGIGGTLRTVEKLGGVATASAVPIAVPENIVTRTIGRWFK